jgi:hypothetical protein
MKQYKEREYGAIMYQMILEGDLTGFYERLYKPMLRSKYYDQAFPEEKDFERKLAEYGDTAIKMLYIPYSLGVKKDVLAPYSVLETFKGSVYDPYIKSLNWLLVVEAINYNSFYSLVLSTGMLSTVEDDYKAKQLMHSVTRELTGLNKSAKEKYLDR